MANLKQGKAYFLKVKHFGRELKYKGIIKKLTNKDFLFITKDCEKLRFELNQIIYSKEINEKKAKPEIKPLKVGKRKRIPYNQLKKIDGPEGI